MQHFKNFFLVLMSLIITIIIVELLLIFFYPQPLSGSWRTQNESGLWLNKKTGSSKHDFINKNNKISVRYHFGEYHNRIYKNINYQLNRKKILVLGDSYTFGWLLKDEDTFIFKLQKKYNYFEFINSSAGGWGASDYLNYLENYCQKINPNQILIIINHSDNLRSINSNLYKLQNGKIVKGKNQISSLKKKLNKIDEVYSFLIENFNFLQILRKVYNQKTNIRVNLNTETTKTISEPYTEAQYEFLKKLYIQIKLEAEKCNSNLNFVELAWPDKFVPSKFISLNAKIKGFIVQEGINFFSLEDQMNLILSNSSKYIIPNDNHPNKKGSEYIYMSLLNKKIFDRFE